MYRQFIAAPSSGFPSQVSLMVQFHTKTTHDPSSGSSTALIKLEPKKLKILTNKGIHFDETSSEASNTSRRSSLTKSINSFLLSVAVVDLLGFPIFIY